MKYLIIPFAALTLFACKNKADMQTSEVAVVTEEQTADAAEVKPIIIDPDYRMKEDQDPFNISATKIEGDILTIIVSYSGGCEDHVFDLYTNKKYMKSMPPQLNLILEHDGNGDACRAMISQDLKFDISEIKTAMSPNLRLNITNYRTPLLYEY